MELKNQLIPYSASSLPEGPYLVFAPHPDDETIGMGGTIALASQKDISVTVVVITDEAEAGEIQVRQVEARAAADLLGVNELIFPGSSDRQVDSLKLAALDILNLINKTGARTIFLPSPLDYHPDHRAVTSYVASFLQENRKTFSGAIWFYETMRQTEVNRLIDITPTVEKKKKALNAYESRLREKAYDELCISINRIRAFTLPAEVEFAEGFWAVPDLSVGALRSVIQSYSSYLQVPSEKPLVSIIVRTKDRPKMLERALNSIRGQNYRPIEAVVVNDGGCLLDLDHLSGIAGDIRLEYIYQANNLGRAGAANIGLDNATGKYLGFLDDDDELLPDHVPTLVTFLERKDYKVAYTSTEVVCVKYMPDKGEMVPVDKGLFNMDFDYQELLSGNYIPFNSLLFSKEIFMDSTRLDENFELYEDWDLLIRIGENHPFFHIDKVTARYYQWSRDNQINQKDSGLVESMKKKVLDKHREKITVDTILSLRKKKDQYWAELKQRENKHLQIMAMKEHEISNLQDRISSMNNAIQAREERIDQLGKETNKQILIINEKEAHIKYLEESVSLMKSSVAWRMYESFARNRERFLPPGTYRRRAYERIRHLYSPKGYVSRISLPAPLNKHVIGRGLQVLKKQGPITFARYTSEYLLNHGRLKSNINPKGNAYDEWIQRHEVWDEEEVKAEVEGFKYKPKISVITPCFNVEPHWLKRCIESVCQQFYDNWELCIYDDGSTENSLLEFLKDAMSLDTRIKIQFGKENRGISFASNQALKMASGEFVALLDNDDELSPIALSEVVRVLNKYPDTDYIYSDEDRIEDDNGKIRRHAPFFKPDWSPHLLFNCMYTGHLSVYRKSLMEELGGFRPEYDFSQDYDLALRVTEKTDKIYHIPKILYHWRVIPGSAAAGDKYYARKSNMAALEDAVRRRRLDAQVIEYPFANRVKFNLSGCPFVSIIIPSDSENNIFNCIDLLKKNTSYPNYEVIAVCNSHLCDKIDTCYQQDSRIKSCPFDGPFSFSLKCNLGTKAASGELLLFLNDDIEAAEQKDWIETLVSVLQKKGAGGVSPKLFYEDDTIQYAGMVTGVRNLVGTAFHCQPKDSGFYFNMILSEREVSLLSGACMLIPRRIFEEVGGFDAENTPVMHSDIDLCFRIREKGYRLVYTPFASLRHIGHLSLKEVDQQNKKEKDKAALYILKKWGDYLSKDLFYTSNMRWILYQNGTIHYKLIAGRQEEPVKDTKDILLVTHDLSLSGAPILMCNLAKFLKENGYFVIVMSPVDGQLSEKYKKYNIPIVIDESLSSTPLEEICNFMGNFDLLIANTILMWPSVLVAKERHLAAIWMIHESRAGKEIALSEKGAQKAFRIADMLIFGCRSNQDLYRGLQHGTNFRTIHYGTEGLRISDDVSDQNFNGQKFTILHIGSIETRKGQDVLIEAVKGMSKEYRDKIQVFLIGRKLNNPDGRFFFEKMQRLLKGSSNIEWLGELPHREVATLMYRAQLFVCSSRDEVFPLTVLEAMSAGKPVIAADVGGIREMITDGADGFIVPNGDFQSLREKIEYCIKNSAILQKVGENARERFLKEFSLNKFGNRFLSILEEFVK